MCRHDNILEWLSQRNPPILPNTEGADLAVRSERLHILEWSSQQDPPILPTTGATIDASLDGNIYIRMDVSSNSSNFT